MDHIASVLNNDEALFLLVGGTIAIVAILGGTISSIVKNVHRERTRREIAAYIAEGSMSPEQGEKLIRAKFRDE